MSRLRTQWGRGRAFIVPLALVLVLSLVMAACGDDGDDDAADTTGGDDGDGSGETVQIGWIPWDEDVAVTQLWNQILQDEGYDVELTQLDVAPLYQGLAEGDLDVFLDGWLPATHSDYWEEFGDQLEDISIWYDQGTLNIAVPEYVDLETIGDLQGNADMFDGQIVGIEPGAGLMRVTREDAMPGYGLDGFTLVEGSTPAMLAELESAVDDEEPVVVTLWHPHWAYEAYPIKDLEDPEGYMGDAEELHVLGRDGFEADFPQVAEWLSNFEMDDASLASLENLVINEYEEGQEAEAVDEWLSDPANQELVDSWLT